MKRALVLACVLAVAWGVAAMASGPMFGIGIEPAAGSQATFAAGWGFNTWELFAEKSGFDSWYGDWGITALWTPEWSQFYGRVGAAMDWYWDATGLYYSDLAFILGVEYKFGLPAIYAQLEIGTATWLVPRVGVEFTFPWPNGGDE